MSIAITQISLEQTIAFIVSAGDRKFKEILVNVQDTDHEYYRKYGLVRSLVLSEYQVANERLQGFIFLFSTTNQYKIIDQIKAAQRVCRDNWKLADHELLLLQCPGTKAPFYIKEAA